MNDDIRTRFHKELVESLKNFALQVAGLKATKKGLKFFCPESNKIIGELYFEYLRNAGGVYVGCEVYGGRMHETVVVVGDGWKSNLLNKSTLSFNSLSEKNREFSNETGGVIRLYDRMDVHGVVFDIVNRLSSFHLPKIKNLIDCNPALIDDLQVYPDHYSHPIVIAAICCKKNNLPESDLLIQKMAHDKRMGQVVIAELDKRVSLHAIRML